MNWQVANVFGMQCWQAHQGNWSFVILKDKRGFVCSYKNFGTKKLAVTFRDKSGFHPSSIADVASEFYYYHDLKTAQKACRDKYKELLLR